MKKPDRRMHRVRIQHAEGVQKVLRRIYEMHGNHRDAAAWLGISQPTFTRLLNGTTSKAMSFHTYAKIHGTLTRHDPEPIDALLNPDHPYRGLLGRFVYSVLEPAAWAVREVYHVWLDKEYWRLRAKAEETVRELWEHPPARRHLSRLLREGTGRPELPSLREKRYWVALYRAVEPLCDGEITDGMERPWQELERHRELDSYLSAAVRREIIMLDRERDLERARRIGRRAHMHEEIEDEDLEGPYPEWPARRWPLMWDDDEPSEDSDPERPESHEEEG